MKAFSARDFRFMYPEKLKSGVCSVVCVRYDNSFFIVRNWESVPDI